MVVLATSCEKENSEDVNQDRIYAKYEVGFDAREGKTESTATFFFGNITGTVLELTLPSKIEIDTFEMQEKTLPFTFYYKSFNGVKPGTSTFKFEDTEGNIFTNSIDMADSIDFVSPGTINKNNNYTLTWIGNPIGQYEEIMVKIIKSTGASSDDDYEYFTENGVGATSIVLPASKLSTLPNGQFKMFIKRTYSPPLLDGTSAGGTIESYFYTLEKSLTIQ